MVRKFILFFIICTLVVSGFAQKNKKNSISGDPKSDDFAMLINGDTIPAERYCPGDTILFDFIVLNPNIDKFTYCWEVNYYSISICDSKPIKLAFPITTEYPNVSNYKVTLVLQYTLFNYITLTTTLTHTIYIDHIRTDLDTSVCQGRDITVPTLKGNVTFTNVQHDEYTRWDTLSSVSGCDSLVRWHIIMDHYITHPYDISSCDSVVWGDGTNANSFPTQIIVRRPPDYVGDYTDTIQRVFFASDPDYSCDTLIKLKVTIIDTGKLVIKFDQDDFCKNDDMEGKIGLETNFTAFDWKYFSRENQVQPDSTWIGLTDPYLDNITEPGFYHVYAYMDTSLYDTLDYIRIVATTCAMTKDTIVEDCKLVIPNVFTPNGDEANQYFGIKKLNLKRENELIIHDRWGKEVFRQKNYQCVYKSDGFHNTENAFDGHSRGGQKLPDGTYYYAFKYDAFPKKKAKTYTGVVVILRD